MGCIHRYYALELDEDEMDVGEAEVSMATQGNHSVMAGPRPASVGLATRFMPGNMLWGMVCFMYCKLGCVRLWA